MSLNKRNPYKDRVTAREFVTVWVRCKTVCEAATKLAVNPQSAQQRARKYIEKGIKLINLPYGGKGKGKGLRININELNELIKRTTV